MSERGDVLAERLADDAYVASARSFEDFFELEYERLLGALYLVTGDLHEAEELMQDAFVRLLERWDFVQGLADPTGYPYRTAMNGFRSRYRRSRVAIRRLPLLAREPSDPFGEVEMRTDVRTALAALTPRQRAAVVLTELLGYPPSEAAATLGVRPSTVRALTAQGRAAMRQHLGGTDV